MIEFPKPNVFISKCLGFEHCRWNSAIISDEFIRKLLPYINHLTTCPELDIGLGVPRNPIRIIQIEDKLRLIQHSSKKDVSEDMLKFADEYLTSIKSMNLDGFILKNRSPSCGIKDVKIYPKVEKSAALTKKASGFFGSKVYEHFPHLPIEDEGRLRNDEIRENFLTKLFLFARFRKIKEKQEFSVLVDFHRTNKYLLRIYSQKEMRILGRIVGNEHKKDINDLVNEYEEHLVIAMSKKARRTAIIDVLLHFLGYFSKELNSEEKSFFLENLELYRNQEIPLSNMIILLRAWIIRFNQNYLREQTFFSPYPAELAKIE